jgi:sulfonate transport system substrate-binding protein
VEQVVTPSEMEKRRTTMRSISLSLLAIISGTLACSPQASAEAQKVRIAHSYIAAVPAVLREKGFLEKALAGRNVEVQWVTALGSNKTFEFLRGGSLDFGSSGGSAALVARGNGNPVEVLSFVSHGELMALATLPNSGIKTPADLKGKKVAATPGTEPYYLLLRGLEQYGLTIDDIKLVPLIHPDGRLALENGNVDAWAGLDPDLAKVELQRGAVRFYRNPAILSGSVLVARDQFVKNNPELTAIVLRAHEEARKWIIEHPDETVAIISAGARITTEEAKLAVGRLDFAHPAITKSDYEKIGAFGDLLKKVGDIPASTDVNGLLDQLLNPAPFTQAVGAKG